MALNQYKKAIIDFTKIIELNPNANSAVVYLSYFSRAFCYKTIGDIKRATLDEAKFIELANR